MARWKTAEFSELVGKTINSITGCENGSDEIYISTTHGAVYRMVHFQDCCEYVRLEDTCGDVADLLGQPVLLAEETSNHTGRTYDSETWTFYKIATINGGVTLRWLGESNGYYSESVDFERLIED